MFAQLPEFDFIRSLIPTRKGRAELGIGDDCALLGGKLYTCDASVEGVHFRMDWSTPEQIVEKALLSNLSDINAMGGCSEAALLALGLNRNWGKQIRERFAVAIREAMDRHNIELLGGDTVSSSTGFLSFTLIGAPGKSLLRRSSAKPGDTLFLSGPLGGSAAGLHALQSGNTSQWGDLTQMHQLPSPPLHLGPWLAERLERGAGIDTSDGLSSELHHLAQSSGVKLEVDWEQIPRASGLDAYCQEQDIDPRSFVLNGGEDYQLLLSFPATIGIFHSMPSGFMLHPIGRVSQGKGVFLMQQGQQSELPPNSWSHLDN